MAPFDFRVLRRVLVVEDELGVQAALAVALEEDFLVSTASTGAEALQRLSETWPDLVLLDVWLPDLDGAAVLRAIRATLPCCVVFVVSACDDAALLRELTSLRVDGLFRKPFDIGSLRERIATALELSRPSRELSRQADGPLSDSERAVGRYVARAIGYLSQHYAEPVTLDAIAAAIGVSASHLAHRFVLETNITVKEYLTKIRIEVAKRILIETDQKLDSIADAAGFYDASHLSRVFREHAGYSPGAYRRLHSAATLARRGDRPRAL